MRSWAPPSRSKDAPPATFAALLLGLLVGQALLAGCVLLEPRDGDGASTDGAANPGGPGLGIVHDPKVIEEPAFDDEPWPLQVEFEILAPDAIGPLDWNDPWPTVQIVIRATPEGPAPKDGMLRLEMLDADVVMTETYPVAAGAEGPKDTDKDGNLVQGHEDRGLHAFVLHDNVTLRQGVNIMQAAARWLPGENQSSWPGQITPSPEDRVDVLAGFRIQLNASHAWYPEQKVFDTHLLAPYMPTRYGPRDFFVPDAHELLVNASKHHGFALDAPYRDDLGAHYIQGINGTDEAWCDLSACSYSWMIHLNGELAESGIDHIRPEPQDHLELRYMRCYSTGKCEDPGQID